MNKGKFTYEKSDVNIALADKFVKFISKNSSKNKLNKNIEGFGSISSITTSIQNTKML